MDKETQQAVAAYRKARYAEETASRANAKLGQLVRGLTEVQMLEYVRETMRIDEVNAIRDAEREAVS